jgi:photosystem II stability/assembly factor-like uncharacterized protein
MKLKLTLSILLITLLTACGSIWQVNPVPSTPVGPSSTPNIVTVAPLPPTSTPVIVPPSETPIALTDTPVAIMVVPNPQIKYFHMTDPLNGWAVGETYILHTADGGLTWYNVTPPTLTSAGFSAQTFFANANLGWVAVPSADFLTSTLYHTTDGGYNWTSVPLAFRAGMMQFLGASNGVMLVPLGAGAGSEAVSVYKTADGGTTWTQVYTNDPNLPGAGSSLPLGGMKSGITFLDASRGWVSGNEPAPSFFYLFATQDGGATWTQQTVTLPTGFETAMTEVEAPIFFTAQDGVLPVRLLAEPQSSVYYVSHDAGLTWTATYPLNVRANFSVSSLLDVYLWDGGAKLYISHDTGLTWSAVTTNVNVTDTFSAFQFADTTNGWMLTSDGTGHTTFYKTTDGGATWTLIIP